MFSVVVVRGYDGIVHVDTKPSVIGESESMLDKGQVLYIALSGLEQWDKLPLLA
jgi:hypothetical protein